MILLFTLLVFLSRALSTPPPLHAIDIEGWGEYSSLPHSYAIVQRGLVNALTQLHVRIVKSSTTPLYQSHWLPTSEVQRTNQRLAQTTSMMSPSNVHLLDATLRFSFPFDLTPSPTSRHTYVFATTEYGNCSLQYMVQHHNSIPLDASVTIVTPSEWSRSGFINAGVHPQRVVVLRHGVDTQHVGVLSPHDRRAARLLYFPSPSLFINDDKTVLYAHVGSMTYNKGFDIIVSSFIQHYTSSSGGQHARLLLKGLDDLYNSRELFQREIVKQGSVALRLVKQGVIQYVGARLTKQKLHELLCSADVYLTPYRAEGFNMPAQEAAACGLTVITSSLLHGSRKGGVGGKGGATMVPAVDDKNKTPPPPPPPMGKEQHDICIVGAGLSGAVIAERYATTLHKTVYVMEKRNHIGGNCYDHLDEETGIRINRYGAHLFHTKYKRVWDYVQRFSEWTPYEHKVLAQVEGRHVPVPVNIDTVNILFGLNIQDSAEMDAWLKKEQVHFDAPPQNSEEMSLSRVGQRLYETLFKPYTVKQWAKTPAQLAPEVMARIPVRNNRDARYFGDTWQALPTTGYTSMFEHMLNHSLITVDTNTDYFQVRDRLNCGRTYYTGPVDTYFADLGWPKLEYRSLDFVRQVHATKDYYQPNSVVNHPAATTPYTRIVEYKHFLNQTSNKTVIFKEFSKDHGEPYYPVPNPDNQALFQKYKAMSDIEPNVTFVGRLANYKYFNMDQTIKNALELFDQDTAVEEEVPGAATPATPANGYRGAAPTDDWCLPSFCKFVGSTVARVTFLKDTPGYMIVPDQEHLLSIMRETTVEVWKKRIHSKRSCGGDGDGDDKEKAKGKAPERESQSCGAHGGVSTRGMEHIAAFHTWYQVGVSFLQEIIGRVEEGVDDTAE